MQIPGPVEAFILHHLGRPWRAVAWCGHTHGESDVWRVTSQQGEDWVVKVARVRRAYLQEREAYRRWAPHLQAWMPRWIAGDDQLGAQLMSAVDGVPMEALEPQERQVVWRQARRN
ncbi:MAG: hypothetical protein AAFX99_08855 [Myxococcota bacterium]